MKVIPSTMEGYAIGEQDFQELRRSGAIYVDKTMYIEKLTKAKGQFFFLARPRRFGKSLFLSTLKYFFEGKRELFRDLYIDSTDWTWNRYPVLHLDLNNERYTEESALDDIMNDLLSSWEERFGICDKSENDSVRLKRVIQAAHRQTGHKVVILVDEYDKPLIGNLNNDEAYEAQRAKLAAIYSNFKSSSRYIEMAFLTGVSRFSKLSVFSDLNNLRDISFSDDYADVCGITEKELLKYFDKGIQRLADTEETTYEGACRKLKKNYDGYRFGKNGSDIYNPWSILNAMEDGMIANYWVMTGLPTIIADSLRNVDADLERIFNTRCKFSRLAGMDLRTMDPLALLYQTGYLTIKHYFRQTDTVTLGIPNKEVTEGLFDVLLPYYVNVRRNTAADIVSSIIAHLEEGKAAEFVKDLDIFLAGIPYDMHMEDENNFHNALYILLTLIGAEVETEVHTSDGRIDLVVKTPDFIYVIELKYGKSPKTALDQIEEKRYITKYGCDPRRIILIGLNFNTTTRRLDTPEIRQ